MSTHPRDVLEEVAAEDLSRDHVLRRLHDWESRMESLSRQIESWLPLDCQADRVRT